MPLPAVGQAVLYTARAGAQAQGYQCPAEGTATHHGEVDQADGVQLHAQQRQRPDQVHLHSSAATFRKRPTAGCTVARAQARSTPSLGTRAAGFRVLCMWPHQHGGDDCRHEAGAPGAAQQQPSSREDGHLDAACT